MSEVDTGGDVAELDTGTDEGEVDSDSDEARYAALEEQYGEEGGEQAEKPAKAPLPTEEVTKRLEQKNLALRQERRARRALEERLAAIEERQRAPVQRQAEPDYDIPDAVDDPIGALEAMRKMALGMTAQQKAEAEAEQARNAQQSQMKQIASRMGEYEDDFRALTPDYDKAVDHFRKERHADLTEQGYEGAELTRALSTEFIGLVTRSLQAGKDPAEVVYALAKKRGYGVDKAVNKLNALKAGQAATSPLNRGGGQQGEPARLTPADVTKLKGKAFNDAFAKLRAQERGRR